MKSKWHTTWRMSDGKSVTRFCEETGACYGTAWKNIVICGKPVDEACKIAAEHRPQARPIKYYVNDTPLVRYCSENSIPYTRLWRKITKLKGWITGTRSV